MGAIALQQMSGASEVKKRLITPKQLKDEYGIQLWKSRRWRRKRTNLPFLRIERSIFYFECDVEAYLAKCRVEVVN